MISDEIITEYHRALKRKKIIEIRIENFRKEIANKKLELKNSTNYIRNESNTGYDTQINVCFYN